MNDEAVRLVSDYMNRFPPPNLKMSNFEFEERSYTLWTIDQILQLLLDNPNTDADVLIFGFIVQLEYLIKFAKNIVTASIFLTAKRIAEDIYEILKEKCYEI